MVKPRAKFILDILEEHYEELEFLWGQRQSALRSQTYTSRTLFDLEERIKAHVQGLLVGGEQVISLIQDGLRADDPLLGFVASYTLLHLNSESAAQQVMDAFLGAKGGQLDGILQALYHGPIDMIVGRLWESFDTSPALTAVATAEALAFHRQFDPKAPRLVKLLRDEDQNVRQAAWRVVAILGSTSLPGPAVIGSPELYESAMRGEELAVRREAMWAAAWSRQQWLLEHCRKLSNNPLANHWDSTLLLAILGKPTDLERILAAGQASERGPQRFEALGAFGHPAVMETVLEGIESEDPYTAVAAGAAFTKITGANIDSDKRIQLLPEDGHEPDEFEREFLDEVILPSSELAQAHWKKVEEAFSKGTRWCRGIDLSQGATNEALAQLDLESRWAACLRGKFEGTWHGSLVDLEVFPQQPR
jgi:uncharacterized protein (TIGR02270 family)